MVPNELNFCFIKPILKDYKQPHDELSNVRPISISNTLSRIFERILQSKMHALKQSSIYQFGYKNGSSCTHALFTVKECILPNLTTDQSVYSVELDVEIAFDSLCRGLLFIVTNLQLIMLFY
jgi:hypothetical protein